LTIVRPESPKDAVHPDFHRRYLLAHGRDELLVNAAVNAAIAWWLVHRLAVVPGWGKISFGVDTLVAGLLLGVVVTFIVTWRMHRRLRRGEVAPMDHWPRGAAAWAHRLPVKLPARAAVLGLYGVLWAVLVLVLLRIAGVRAMSPSTFIVYKALFAGWVAGFTTAVGGFRALGDGIAPEPPKGPAWHGDERHASLMP
jgi:hypothetical protein